MKTTQQLLEEARKKREAAAAQAAANPPATTAKTDTPVVTASAEKPVVVAGDRVEVDASVVKDGVATVAVEVVDGKSFIAGLALPPAAPTETEAMVGLATELATVKAQLIEANASIDTLALALDSTSGIVAKSLNTMAVALGSGAIDTSAMDPLALVQLHEARSKDFVAKFPVGGVAATGLDDTPEPKANAVSAKEQALHQRQLAALRGARA